MAQSLRKLPVKRRGLVSLPELLAALMDDYRATFNAHKVRLSLVMPGELRVHADAQRLSQAFSDLLDIALKFTPAGGTVGIEVVKLPRDVRIVVRESGRATEVVVTLPVSQ